MTDQAPATEAAPTPAPEAPPSVLDMSEEQFIQSAIDMVDDGSPAPEPTEANPEPAKEAPKEAPEGEVEQEATGTEDASTEPDEANPEDRSWAALNRREEAARKREQSIKEQEKRLEELEAKAKEYDDEKATLGNLMRQDPLKFMRQYGGISENDLADALLKDGKVTPKDGDMPAGVMQVMNELREQNKALSGEINELKSGLHQRDQSAQYDAAIEKYRTDVGQEIEGGKERYPILSSHEDAIHRVTLKAADMSRSGAGDKDLAPSLVAARVEAELREKYSKQLSSEAFRSAFGLTAAQAPSDSGTSTKPQSGEPETPRTLTNSLGAAPPVNPEKDVLDMTEDEFIRYATSFVTEE